MQNQQIEAWALNVIDRVVAGQPHEDARVELKAEWPSDLKRTARQIAAHANAVRGPSVLWLIGVDEKRGVLGTSHTNLATWWPSVKAEFDGVAPTIIDLNVPFNGKTVVALYFETDRPPYVVKNGANQLEVPWREGTTTRSVNRSELIRILSPIQQLPHIDVLSAQVQIKKVQSAQGSEAFSWRLDVHLYLAPRSNDQLVFPVYKCKGQCELPGLTRLVTFQKMSFNQIVQPPVGEIATVSATINELIVRGPGAAHIHGEAIAAPINTDFMKEAKISINLGSAGDGDVLPIRLTLSPLGGGPKSNQIARWTWKRDD